MARDFVGLGYEMSSVARAGLLSAQNEPYVRLVRSLGTGVMRVGGIVADYTRYDRMGVAKAEPKDTVINYERLQQFRGFLEAVQWGAIWSVNFGQGTLKEAMAEVTDVAKALGPRLLAVELGNEVENYGHGQAPLRAPGYSYEAYRAEFTRWRSALLEAVPGLRFAAPDTAASVAWVERMAADADGEVQLLTTHYYRGDQKLGTEAQLLTPDAALAERLERLGKAARVSGIPWRMCETNSFYGGGRPGVSDTLAGALWTLDFMLLLAARGCAGVNMETGVNQLGFVSSYSPLQDDGRGHNRAGAPYYGMLAFAMAARETTKVVEMRADGNDAGGLTAYGLEDPNRLKSLILINKDARRGERVSLREFGVKAGWGMRLTGRSLSSGEEITFAGKMVDARGEWSAVQQERVRGAEIAVPAGSAVVVFLTY